MLFNPHNNCETGLELLSFPVCFFLHFYLHFPCCPQNPSSEVNFLAQSHITSTLIFERMNELINELVSMGSKTLIHAITIFFLSFPFLPFSFYLHLHAPPILSFSLPLSGKFSQSTPVFMSFLWDSGMQQ